jgi:hypothetical protein
LLVTFLDAAPAAPAAPPAPPILVTVPAAAPSKKRARTPTGQFVPPAKRARTARTPTLALVASDESPDDDEEEESTSTTDEAPMPAKRRGPKPTKPVPPALRTWMQSHPAPRRSQNEAYNAWRRARSAYCREHGLPAEW